MRQVMLAEQNLFFADAEFRLQRGCDPELVDHPRNHRLAKHLPRLRISLQHHHEDAVEFAEWLLKKHDVVEILAP